MQTAQPRPPSGEFGLPRPSPAGSEDGPVLPREYADASANLIPAIHSLGLMQALETKSRLRKQAKGPYHQAHADSPFERDTPDGHEGLVFSAVVFTA